MTARLPRHLTARVVACAAAFAIAAGCTSPQGPENPTGATGDGTAVTTVTIAGPEVEGDAQNLTDAFAAFTTDTGIAVDYTGDRALAGPDGPAAVTGTPDIVFVTDARQVRDQAGELAAVPDDTADLLGDVPDGLLEAATADGVLYGVPTGVQLNDLIWYDPAAFDAAGYTTPTTTEALFDQADTMIDDGHTPFCVGLAGPGAGEVLAAWSGAALAGRAGPEVYRQWADHGIAADASEVLEAVASVTDLWATGGMVAGGLTAATATPVTDAGLPLLSGDCLMHRQGSWYAAAWPIGTTVGPDGGLDVFTVPPTTGTDATTVVATTYAVAFSDRPEVQEVLAFLAGDGYAIARAGLGSFLSAHQGIDTASYPTGADRTFAEVWAGVDAAVVDARDQMPTEVAAAFDIAAGEIVTGTRTPPEALAAVEAAWP